MGHENAASEVGLSQDKRQAHSMVEMETELVKRLAHGEQQLCYGVCQSQGDSKGNIESH